jgi:hypothetical protein
VGGSAIGGDVNLNSFEGFGASNQGHSAQYYSNYFERRDYWRSILDNFGFALN